MANAWQGLGEGLERGLRIGMTMEEREQNKEDRIRRQGREDELYAQQKEDRARRQKTEDFNYKSAEQQFNWLKDDKERAEKLRQTDLVLYNLGEMSTDFAGYADRINKDPKNAEEVRKAMAAVGNVYLSETGQAGKIAVDDLELAGQDENGRPQFKIVVTNKDGKQSYITNDRTARADNDPSNDSIFGVDDIGSAAASLKARIKKAEAEKVGLGDKSSITAREAKASKLEDRAYEESKDERKYKHQLGIEGLRQNRMDARASAARTASGGNGKPILQLLRDDPATGEKTWGLYDATTRQIITLTDEQAFDFRKLTPEEQDAFTVQSLSDRGVTPQNEHWFSPPEYTDEQRMAESARLKMMGKQPAGYGGISAPSSQPQAQQGQAQQQSFAPSGIPVITPDERGQLDIKSIGVGKPFSIPGKGIFQIDETGKPQQMQGFAPASNIRRYSAKRRDASLTDSQQSSGKLSGIGAHQDPDSVMSEAASRIGSGIAGMIPEDRSRELLSPQQEQSKRIAVNAIIERELAAKQSGSGTRLTPQKIEEIIGMYGDVMQPDEINYLEEIYRSLTGGR